MERANISSNRIPHPNNSVCDNVLGRRVRVHKCSTFKLESCEQLLIQLLDSCDGGLKREFPPRALYRGRLDRLDACGACFWNNNNFKISSRSSFRSISPREDCLCSPKYGSPVLAHILDLVVTIALIGLASFLYGTISSLYGAVAASMIYFAFVGVGAVVFAIRHGSEFGGRKGIGGRIVLALAGSLQTLIFAFLAFEFFAYPKVWGGNSLAYGYIVATFIVGVIVYFVSKSIHAKRGIDISIAFKEIPPE